MTPNAFTKRRVVKAVDVVHPKSEVCRHVFHTQELEAAASKQASKPQTVKNPLI